MWLGLDLRLIYPGTERAHICPSTSPTHKPALRCSPSLTLAPEGWIHIAADATARKEGEGHRRAEALGFSAGSD